MQFSCHLSDFLDRKLPSAIRANRNFGEQTGITSDTASSNLKARHHDYLDWFDSAFSMTSSEV